MLASAVEVITIAPEDYRVFSEAYKDYSNMNNMRMGFEVSPIELRLLKSLQIDGNGEEIYLHAACFATPYVGEVIKRLTDLGFRVRKVEGCSGAILEKNLGKRADKMARALGAKYPMLVTLCPLASLKFKENGIPAKTLVEFIAEKVGLTTVVTAGTKAKLELSDSEKQELRNTITTSLLKSLSSKSSIIVDTVTFTSSGIDEYKKIVESVIVEALSEAGDGIKVHIKKLLENKKAQGATYDDIVNYLSALIRELSNVISTMQLDSIIDIIINQVKGLTSEQFDEGVLRQTLILLVRENEKVIKERATALTADATS